MGQFWEIIPLLSGLIWYKVTIFFLKSHHAIWLTPLITQSSWREHFACQKPSELLQDRFNETQSTSITLVLTQFIAYATTMKSHFFIILIFISPRWNREWGGSITPLSAHSTSNLFLQLPPLLHVHSPHLFSSLPHFFQFPPLRARCGCFHSDSLVHLALFSFAGRAARPWGYIWSGRWLKVLV